MFFCAYLFVLQGIIIVSGNEKILPPPRIEIPLTVENGEYFGTITIGEPKIKTEPQVLKVLFDTGSHHIWVVSSTADNIGLDNKGNPKQCKKYDGTLSTSYSTRNNYAEQSFVLGKVVGFFSEDTVQVGYGHNAITIPVQGFAEAKEIYDKNLFSNHDGIVGLGLIEEELLDYHPKSLLMKIDDYYQYVPKFGLFMPDGHPEQSKLIFGDDHHDLIDGEFTTHKVVETTMNDGKKHLAGWYLEFEGFHVGQPGQMPEVLPALEEMLIFPDSGTDTLVGPPAFIDELYTLVFAGTGITVRGPEYSFPCPDPREMLRVVQHVLPVVAISINGRTYTLYPEDYLGIGANNCRGLFIGMPNTKHILLGRIFLKNYYTVFDYQKKEIHIGVSK